MKRYMGKIRGKRLFFTRHVFDRSYGRKVKIKAIMHIAENFEISYKTLTGNTNLTGSFKGKKNSIIVHEDAKDIIVVSCW